MNLYEVDLNTIADGVLPIMFHRELNKALENIADVNTDLKDRKIVMTVTLKPNEDRRGARVLVEAVCKTRGPEARAGSVFIQRNDKNEIVPVAQRPMTAEDLPFEQQIAEGE